MSWFHKSVKFGPLRVNVSSHGVGTSLGVRGARVGVGPRGTYVSFSTGGFGYRKKLTSQRAKETRRPPGAVSPAGTPVSAVGNIVTASVQELAQASPDWVVQDSQARLRKWNYSKAYAWTGALFVLFLWANTPPAVVLTVCIALAGSGVLVHRWDRERRTTRIIYDVDDPEIVERLAMANGAASWLGSCAALNHIYHSIGTSDWKTNAGANTLLRRTRTRCAVGALPAFDLNVETWCVPVGPQQLLFLPDRLLVWDGNRLAALPYETVTARASATRFIESEAPPPDGRQVGTTWRFVRRDGGPDLRFSNNAQLPVMEYGELTLSSASGLNIVLQTSTLPAAEGAARVLSLLGERAGVRMAAHHAQPSPPTPASEPTHTVQPTVSSDPQRVARSVVVLLRYLAGADRRIDRTEVDLAWRTLGQIVPQEHPTLAQFESAFRALVADECAVANALQELSAAAPDFRRWVMDVLNRLAGEDGRVTPKETERLREVQRSLGV